MNSIILTVGIGISLLVVGFAGGYLISGQTSHMNMMGGMMDSNTIIMGMDTFMPNKLHIEPNATISWQTHDMETHNVVGIFKTDLGKEIPIFSGDIDHMESWNYTFEESGVFEYSCGYHEHEGMKGEIVIANA
ncbi:MAG: plastocyanin/azurin family copper-binding protein [Nitrosopumilus sp.]|jgi:plastocyanin